MEEKGSMMNRTIKAAVGMVAIAAMSVGTLGACGSSSSSDDGKGKVYYLNFKPESNDEWQKLAKDYTKETGVEVKVQTAASGTYEQTLKSEIAKSEAPTLFQVNGPVGYQNWKSYTDDMTDTEPYKQLINKDVALKDGSKVVGVPYAMETYGLIYNKDLLAKYIATDGAKIKDVKDIDNFDTLKAVADDIQAKKDQLGVKGAFTSAGFDSSSDWRFKTHLANLPLYYEFKDDNITKQPETVKGTYLPEYEGELRAELDREESDRSGKNEQEGGRYILAVHQGDTVCTLFFKKITLECELYDYGHIGHFWVKDYEYLRQLEYRLAILRDKYDYLGEAYCTEEEIKLAALVEFPPLNYCCYPAVPEKYIVPRENPWIPSEKAIVYMKELAAECEDASLLKMLEFYRKHPAKFWAKRLAVMLHQTKHSRIVDLLSERLQQATADYPRRFFGDDVERKYQQALERAKQRQRELKSQGIRADLLREEPFTIARDSLNYKLYLMIWKEQKGNRVTEIEEYICE